MDSFRLILKDLCPFKTLNTIANVPNCRELLVILYIKITKRENRNCETVTKLVCIGSKLPDWRLLSCLLYLMSREFCTFYFFAWSKVDVSLSELVTFSPSYVYLFITFLLFYVISNSMAFPFLDRSNPNLFAKIACELHSSCIPFFPHLPFLSSSLVFPLLFA